MFRPTRNLYELTVRTSTERQTTVNIVHPLFIYHNGHMTHIDKSCIYFVNATRIDICTFYTHTESHVDGES